MVLWWLALDTANIMAINVIEEARLKLLRLLDAIFMHNGYKKSTDFWLKEMFPCNEISSKFYFVKLEICIHCFITIWNGDWSYFSSSRFIVLSVFIVMGIYCSKHRFWNWEIFFLFIIFSFAFEIICIFLLNLKLFAFFTEF